MSGERRIAMISSHLGGNGCVSEDLSTIGVSGTHKKNGLGLDGQVAIITGSAQGIGEATARHFAREGVSVVITDLDATKADAVAQSIRSDGGKAIAVPGDITDPKFPDKLVEETIKTYGKLNIIVNNAGYTWDGMAHKITDKQWEAMLAVHQTAPFRIIRAAAPYMRDEAKKEIDTNGVAQPRCIINISSTSGLHGNIGQANYATGKMGILGLTKTIAKEWGMFQIRCNAIAFGFIDTRLTRAKEKGEYIEVEGRKVQLGIPQANNGNSRVQAIPLQRAGTAEEAASSIVALASPLASYVTGHCLEVTGGVGI